MAHSTQRQGRPDTIAIQSPAPPTPPPPGGYTTTVSPMPRPAVPPTEPAYGVARPPTSWSVPPQQEKKGGGAALTGLLSGDVQMMIDLMVSVYPNAKAGKIRGLGVTTLQPVSTAPELPTLDATGLPGFQIAASDGVYAPAGTPRPIVEKLNAAFRASLEDAKVRENLMSRGAFPVPGTPEDLAKHVATEYPMWIRLVKESGAKVD